MPRGSGLPEDILDAIVARLIDQIPDLCKPETCYQAIDPDDIGPSLGDVTFVVAPMSGNFPQEYYEGGGLEQLTVFGGVTVKIHSPLQLDQAGRDLIAMIDRPRGLWRVARRVIRALANPEWSPMKGDNEITRDPLVPAGYDISRGGNRKSKRKIRGIELNFRLNFDWDVLNTDGEGD